MNIKQIVLTTAHKRFVMLKAQFKRLQSNMLSGLWSRCLKWAWSVSKSTAMINMWAEGVQDKILSGELTLVQGQLCICGDTEHPARFVGTNGASIHLVHWQGSESATQRKYEQAVNFNNNKRG